MDPIHYIEIFAAIAGIVLSALLSGFPRFGSASWMPVLILLPASMSSAISGVAPVVGWLPADVAFGCFACLILCGAAGCVVSYTIERDNRPDLRKNRWFFVSISATAPVLIAGLFLFRPPVVIPNINFVALGPAGFGGAGYLLLVSIVIVANISQILRGTDKGLRPNIKFLLIGIVGIFANVIYIASQILMYPPELSYLPLYCLRVFPVVFLCACLLIFQSWKRSKSKDRSVVSLGVYEVLNTTEKRPMVPAKR